jgi:hypothetical protein
LVARGRVRGEQRYNPKIKLQSKYDFSKMSGTVRGKYFEAYRLGHAVKIRKKNGQVSVHYFKPEEGAVMLEPIGRVTTFRGFTCTDLK